jgi:4-hydroxy-4-methyl-2-oxoglutarate aldolase
MVQPVPCALAKRVPTEGKVFVSEPEIPPQVWQLDAASLSDANKALRILPRELRPYNHGLRMVGRAVTVTASADLVPVLAGLEQCSAGEVLVVDAGTTEHAVLGELFATEAVRRGLAGIVVYGLCRDTATLAELPLPIYSLGTIPRAVGATALPITQQPVRLGDVEVRPGEILVGDDDGIVVLSDAELDAALETAQAIQQREDAIRTAMRNGTSLFDQLNFHEHVANLQAGQPSSLAFRVQ